VVVPRVEPGPSRSLPGAFRPPALEGRATSREGGGKAAADVQRVLALFMGGASIPEIVAALHGVDSSGGRRYLELRAEVEEAIRSGLEGRP
jgi:hypothetical protein